MGQSQFNSNLGKLSKDFEAWQGLCISLHTSFKVLSSDLRFSNTILCRLLCTCAQNKNIQMCKRIFRLLKSKAKKEPAIQCLSKHAANPLPVWQKWNLDGGVLSAHFYLKLSLSVSPPKNDVPFAVMETKLDILATSSTSICFPKLSEQQYMNLPWPRASWTMRVGSNKRAHSPSHDDTWGMLFL